MFRRFLFPGLGALALLVALGTPAQVHAQRMHGGFPNRAMPGFRGGFGPRFHRGFFFGPRFHRGFFTPGFGPGFTPGFTPGFGPGFFRPF
jgi:hypothetical protein